MSNPDEHFFPNEKGRWVLTFRMSTSYQTNKLDERKFPSKPGRFYFWNCMNTLATGGAHRWARRMSTFFSDKQKTRVIIFSVEQAQLSTIPQMSMLRWALFFRWARTDEHSTCRLCAYAHHSDEGCSSLDFFSDEQQRRALIFTRASLEEHYFSDNQD